MKRERWCIYIDVQGFSKLWLNETPTGIHEALHPLRAIMEALYRIGTLVYPESPERLFVHQTGDGFAVVSDFGEDSLARPVAICVAVFRHVASFGYYVSAAIAEGGFSDIKGCYPTEVRNALDENGREASLGNGLMTIWPVMGSALVHAHELSTLAPSGPLLIVSESIRARIPNLIPMCRIACKSGKMSLLSLDWIHADDALIGDIQSKANLVTANPATLAARLLSYCDRHKLMHWERALRHLGISR